MLSEIKLTLYVLCHCRRQYRCCV